VTKVCNSGQVTALCLLALTAAFNTVDHDLLMLRRERQFGIHGVDWFRSYTCKADRMSSTVVPRRPWFTLPHCSHCATRIGSWCPSIRFVSVVQLEEVSHSMPVNRLKLNADGTTVGGFEVQPVVVGKGLLLQIGPDAVTASNHVRVLGVTFSADLSLDKHVCITCASCFFWLRQLRRVRRSLDDESVKTLVHAFVTARDDYSNTVLASLRGL